MIAASVRYDFDLTDDAYDAIVKRIQSGPYNKDFRCIEKQSVTRSLWRIVVDGKAMRVVYDKKRKCLVTFVPDSDIFLFDK